MSSSNICCGVSLRCVEDFGYYVDKANIHKIITPDVSDKMDVFDDSNQNDISRYVTKKNGRTHKIKTK